MLNNQQLKGHSRRDTLDKPIENTEPIENTNDFIVETLDRPIQVVFEDDHYVGVFKPAGLMVHRGPKTLATEPVLLQTLRDQLNRFLYPIHRLDRPTAGLIFFAYTSEAASRMGELFTQRRIEKTYQALVRGFMPDEVTVDRPLGDHEDGKAKAYGESKERSAEIQDAVTHFRCLRRYEVPWPMGEFPCSRFSLLEVQPHTGRWHQIRRHLNHLAHPVIGDHRHGDHRWNQMFYQRTGVYRMLLTSMRVDFRHPFTHEPISLLVSRGESFDQALNWIEHGRMNSC